MYKKLLFHSKPIPVVLALLFLTLNAFSFKSSGISSSTFSQSTSTIRKQPVQHPATVNKGLTMEGLWNELNKENPDC